MTPDTFRHSPEILPGRRLRLEKIHARHAPALYASVRRSMPELDYIAWGHQRWDEEAARRQAAQGDAMNGPAPVLVELAETLVGMIPHADWCLFQKNGTDATTACVTIARAGTGRRKVLVARGSYHGAAPWCTPSLAGVTAEDRAHLLHFDYNDAASLQAVAG